MNFHLKVFSLVLVTSVAIILSSTSIREAGATVKKLKCACFFLSLPECGEDGKTYGNRCQRECAGVLRKHKGPCPKVKKEKTTTTEAPSSGGTAGPGGETTLAPESSSAAPGGATSENPGAAATASSTENPTAATTAPSAASSTAEPPTTTPGL